MARFLLAPFFGLAFWVPFLAVAGVLSSPVIFFGRHRAQWQLWELTAFVLPHWSWAVCYLIDDSGKSLSNVVEILYLAAAVPLAALIRVAIGHPSWRWCVSVILIGTLSVLAVCLWAFVPWLPE